jgi:hypothetical protein
VWELLDASLPPKDALPTLSSVDLVCELYVHVLYDESHFVLFRTILYLRKS